MTGDGISTGMRHTRRRCPALAVSALVQGSGPGAFSRQPFEGTGAVLSFRRSIRL